MLARQDGRTLQAPRTCCAAAWLPAVPATGNVSAAPHEPGLNPRHALEQPHWRPHACESSADVRHHVDDGFHTSASTTRGQQQPTRFGPQSVKREDHHIACRAGGAAAPLPTGMPFSITPSDCAVRFPVRGRSTSVRARAARHHKVEMSRSRVALVLALAAALLAPASAQGALPEACSQRQIWRASRAAAHEGQRSVHRRSIVVRTQRALSLLLPLVPCARRHAVHLHHPVWRHVLGHRHRARPHGRGRHDPESWNPADGAVGRPGHQHSVCSGRW